MTFFKYERTEKSEPIVYQLSILGHSWVATFIKITAESILSGKFTLFFFYEACNRLLRNRSEVQLSRDK